MSSRGGKDILRDENPSQPIASSTASSTLRSFAYTVPLQSVERHEAKLSQKPTLARLHEASADFKTSEEPSTRPPQDPSIYPEVSHNRSVEEQRNAQAMKSEAYLSDSTSANGRDPTIYKQIHVSQAESFFTVGKVFALCYIENATDSIESKYKPSFTTVAHESIAFHSFRRFVVLESFPKTTCSRCCPITTYHGRATTKPGINPKAYTIIYTGRTAPKKLPQEKIHKDPIQVTEKDDAQSLDPLSRVNLGISYVIAWDVKVVEIGQVRGTSLRLLTNYREMVKEDVFGLE